MQANTSIANSTKCVDNDNDKNFTKQIVEGSMACAWRNTERRQFAGETGFQVSFKSSSFQTFFQTNSLVQNTLITHMCTAKLMRHTIKDGKCYLFCIFLVSDAVRVTQTTYQMYFCSTELFLSYYCQFRECTRWACI